MNFEHSLTRTSVRAIDDKLCVLVAEGAVESGTEYNDLLRTDFIRLFTTLRFLHDTENDRTSLELLTSIGDLHYIVTWYMTQCRLSI